GPSAPGVSVRRAEVDETEVVAIDTKVRRDDRRPAGWQCLDQLALRTPDALHRLHELQVDGTDVRDDADVGSRDLAQVRDLAEAAHRELDDAHLRVRLEATEGERDADLVVEARL